MIIYFVINAENLNLFERGGRVVKVPKMGDLVPNVQLSLNVTLICKEAS
jgi:hypothetical protein